jgi:tripartite-type tricarboxylate transporter receptor subunit TctC
MTNNIMKNASWIAPIAVAAMGVFAYTSAGAQAHPVKPIKIVVPFAPGGSSEIIARSIAQKLSEQFEQVIVDNRPGGAGNIGMPDVPTVQELGYRGSETTQWYGLLAPAKTPEAVIWRLQEEIVKALHSREVQERYAADGTLAVGNTSAEFGEFIQREMTRRDEVVRTAGVKPE